MKVGGAFLLLVLKLKTLPTLSVLQPLATAVDFILKRTQSRDLCKLCTPKMVRRVEKHIDKTHEINNFWIFQEHTLSGSTKNSNMKR